MRHIILVGLGLIPTVFAGGWIKVYEATSQYGWGKGSSVRQTADGGYIITGTRVEGDVWDTGYVDLWLIKTDSAGDTTWTRTYGVNSPYVYDEGLCVQQTIDGGYVVTGYTNGNNMYLAGGLWLLKTDEQGDTQWTKKYSYNFGHEKGYWVEQTKDGGYIITGSCNPTGGMYESLWLLKTDEVGDTLWSLIRPSDNGRCVRQTKDEGYIVASNMGLLKTNDKGDSLWIIPWPGRCVQQTSDDGYVIIGHTWTESLDIRLRKTDDNGDSLWTRIYGGGDEDDGYEVQQTTDGGYIVLGNTKSFGTNHNNVWLLKTDSNGDTLWTRIFGENDEIDRGYSIQQTTDGGYIITGSSGFWGTGVLLIKTDSLGYVSITEEPPVQVESNWQVISSIGPHVVIRYSNLPESSTLNVYDVLGRKVDELRAEGSSGSITWGEGYGPGVYFIKEVSDTTNTTRKVILIR